MKRRGFFLRLQFAILPLIAAGLIRLIHSLMRCELLGRESLEPFWKENQRLLFVFWHDQLFLMAKAYRGNGAKVLISASRDGELIARTMEYFGIGAVRGSSRRGGRAAFRELVQLGEEPFDLAFTPDGPKGPRHQIKDGVIELARITGRPVIPLAFACSRGKRFNSWDRFLLPFPFGRGVFVYGDPLSYEKGEGSDQFRERLRIAMAENQARAVARLRDYGLTAV